MKESVFTIGKSTQLVGVLTEAEAKSTSEHKPTVLILNSGLLGRIGPFRLHVQLARQLAKTGYNAFRLDLSGIGDSERHNDNRSNEEKHLSDIKEVMDFLEKEIDAEKFIIMGICTGAVNAHKTMLHDNRALAAVCIDGYIYKTCKYYINYYLPKIFSAQIWLNHINDLYNRIFNKTENKIVEDDDKKLNYRWELPPKEETETELQKFIDKNTHLFCIYTSTWACNYSNQLADAFPSLKFGNNIQSVYLSDATHTFPVPEDRKALIETISEWLEKTDFNAA